MNKIARVARLKFRSKQKNKILKSRFFIISTNLRKLKFHSKHSEIIWFRIKQKIDPRLKFHQIFIFFYSKTPKIL